MSIPFQVIDFPSFSVILVYSIFPNSQMAKTMARFCIPCGNVNLSFSVVGSQFYLKNMSNKNLYANYVAKDVFCAAEAVRQV